MTADRFKRALELVLRFEGGFVADPRDPGGATNLGITRATLARARGRPVTVSEVRALSRAEAASIYRRLFWAAIRADELPAGLDLAVFDCAVNSGPARAARLLQQALRMPVDGRIGAQTLAAAQAGDPARTVREFTRLRSAFLRGLPTWSAFGRGWARRVAAVEKAGLALAAAPPSAAAPSFTTAKGEKTMTDSKSIFASRTVWANLIGLASVGLGLAGVQTGAIDANGLADAAAQLVAAGSFILSTVFRITAKKQIAAA